MNDARGTIMDSACKGMTEKHLGKCLLKDSCLRYAIHKDSPLIWAAHRTCRTDKYMYYIALEPESQGETQ